MLTTRNTANILVNLSLPGTLKYSSILINIKIPTKSNAIPLPIPLAKPLDLLIAKNTISVNIPAVESMTSFGKNPAGPKAGRGTNNTDAMKPIRMSAPFSFKISLNKTNSNGPIKTPTIDPMPGPNAITKGSASPTSATNSNAANIPDKAIFLNDHIISKKCDISIKNLPKTF